MKRNDPAIRRFWQRMPLAVYWSCDDKDVEYFAQWDNKTDEYLVMNDKSRRLLVVRYYYNF